MLLGTVLVSVEERANQSKVRIMERRRTTSEASEKGSSRKRSRDL